MAKKPTTKKPAPKKPLTPSEALEQHTKALIGVIDSMPAATDLTVARGKIIEGVDIAKRVAKRG